jgi:hypothetical protein
MSTMVVFSRSGMALRHLVAVVRLAESLIGELVRLLFSPRGSLLRLQGRGDRVVAHIAGARPCCIADADDGAWPSTAVRGRDYRRPRPPAPAPLYTVRGHRNKLTVQITESFPTNIGP